MIVRDQYKWIVRTNYTCFPEPSKESPLFFEQVIGMAPSTHCNANMSHCNLGSLLQFQQLEYGNSKQGSFLMGEPTLPPGELAMICPAATKSQQTGTQVISTSCKGTSSQASSANKKDPCKEMGGTLECWAVSRLRGSQTGGFPVGCNVWTTQKRSHLKQHPVYPSVGLEWQLEPFTLA